MRIPKVAIALFLVGQGTLVAQAPPPIIDMHLHTFPATWFGEAEQPMCVGITHPHWTPTVDQPQDQAPDCEAMIMSPATDQALRHETLAIMERLNVIGLASGPPAVIRAWQEASPSRVLGSVFTNWQSPRTLDSIRARAARGEIRAIGEVTTQYAGANPSDDQYSAFWELADELDLPISIHVGLGPPSAAYVGSADYRMALSDPMILEKALLRHPSVRVNVMHAGWPFADEMIALLYAHPQVNVDLGIISYMLPTAGFHDYLQRLVNAGFSKRIMFGSDQMIWPQALEKAIQNVESASFLSGAQKRDILYNNAARFLRLPAN